MLPWRSYYIHYVVYLAADMASIPRVSSPRADGDCFDHNRFPSGATEGGCCSRAVRVLFACCSCAVRVLFVCCSCAVRVLFVCSRWLFSPGV